MCETTIVRGDFASLQPSVLSWLQWSPTSDVARRHEVMYLRLLGKKYQSLGCRVDRVHVSVGEDYQDASVD